MNKNLDTTIKEYIIECIDDEDDENFDKKSRREKVYFLQDTFLKEFIHDNNHYCQDEFKSWIQGLPSCFNIVFYNTDIVELFQKWGVLTENSTDAQDWRVINNYFNFIAIKTFQLFNALEYKTSKILDAK